MGATLSSIQLLDVIGGQHSTLPCSLHRPCHPAVVNGIAVDDHVTIHEAYFVRILCNIIVHSLESVLEKKDYKRKIKPFIAAKEVSKVKH